MRTSLCFLIGGPTQMRIRKLCPQNFLHLGCPCLCLSAFCSGLYYKFQPTSIIKSNFGPVRLSANIIYARTPLVSCLANRGRHRMRHSSRRVGGWSRSGSPSIFSKWCKKAKRVAGLFINQMLFFVMLNLTTVRILEGKKWQR